MWLYALLFILLMKSPYSTLLCFLRTNSIILLCTLLFHSCDDNGSSSSNGSTGIKPGTIKGRVLLFDEFGDSLSNHSGVQITLEGNTNYSTTSATDGSYQFSNVEAGIYILRYQSQDSSYKTIVQENFQFVANGSYNATTMYIEKKIKPAVLLFVVQQFDDDFQPMSGNPKQGIHIEIRNQQGKAYSFDNIDTVRLDNPADGWYDCVVTRKGFVTDSVFVQYNSSGSSKARRVAASLYQYSRKTCVLEIDSIVKQFSVSYDPKTKDSVKVLYPGAKMYLKATLSPYKQGNTVIAGLVWAYQPGISYDAASNGLTGISYPKIQTSSYYDPVRRGTFSDSNVVHFAVNVNKDSTYYVNAYAYPSFNASNSNLNYYDKRWIVSVGPASNTLQIDIR